MEIRKLNMQDVDTEKLQNFGFTKKENGYFYRTYIVDKQFELIVCISHGGEMNTKLCDTLTGEEYVLHLVEDCNGAFVGKVREEYNKVVEELCPKCLKSNVYKIKQTNGAVAYIKEKYDCELEYPFDDDNGVARRADSGKWFAVFLKVRAEKIGLEGKELIEVLNLKLSPENVQKLVDCKSYFPAYHMNKKHWVTVPFGKYVEDDELFSKIDESYNLAKK